MPKRDQPLPRQPLPAHPPIRRGALADRLPRRNVERDGNARGGAPAPLTIEELEIGLRLLSRGEADHEFWDNHIDAFRQTVLLAIRETSDALLSPRIPLKWRLELEGQLESLVRYVELANRYVEQRASAKAH